MKRVILTSLLAAVAGGAAADIEWSYEGKNGPEHWGDLDESFTLCGSGRSQSPIDLSTSLSLDLPDIEFHYDPISTVKVFNNGHTIEVEVEPGSSITVADETYELQQFHWHAPSEHSVEGGARYDLEMHFVHRSAAGELAVVGVFIRRGRHHRALRPIWAVLPRSAGEERAVELELTAANLLPANRSDFRYAGSLTTPPCTEGVHWHVLEQPIQMSPTQVNKFIRALNRSCCLENARPTQPLNGRRVQEEQD